MKKAYEDYYAVVAEAANLIGDTRANQRKPLP